MQVGQAVSVQGGLGDYLSDWYQRADLVVYLLNVVAILSRLAVSLVIPAHPQWYDWVGYTHNISRCAYAFVLLILCCRLIGVLKINQRLGVLIITVGQMYNQISSWFVLTMRITILTLTVTLTLTLTLIALTQVRAHHVHHHRLLPLLYCDAPRSPPLRAPEQVCVCVHVYVHMRMYVCMHMPMYKYEVCGVASSTGLLYEPPTLLLSTSHVPGDWQPFSSLLPASCFLPPASRFLHSYFLHSYFLPTRYPGWQPFFSLLGDFDVDFPAQYSTLHDNPNAAILPVALWCYVFVMTALLLLTTDYLPIPTHHELLAAHHLLQVLRLCDDGHLRQPAHRPNEPGRLSRK